MSNPSLATGVLCLRARSDEYGSVSEQSRHAGVVCRAIRAVSVTWYHPHVEVINPLARSEAIVEAQVERCEGGEPGHVLEEMTDSCLPPFGKQGDVLDVLARDDQEAPRDG